MRLDRKTGFPDPVGLYDPNQEKDSCGVGFVAHVKGQASHQIMLDAYMVNSRMDHRGGCGFEENTGDGAGILTAIPQTFFSDIATDLGFSLPAPGEYAVGNIFLPTDEHQRRDCKHAIERLADEESLTILGWRTVPTAPEVADVGPAAISAMPAIEQCFISQQLFSNETHFERALYVLRKRFTTLLRADTNLSQAHLVYACSLSPRVIVYKGMLTPSQLFPFYPDLLNKNLSLIHI